MFTARAGVGSTHENCGICLDDLSESAVFKTTCNHKFHYKCIKNIAATNHNCPMCRNPNAFEVFDDFNFNEYFKESFEEAIGKIAIDENGEKHWVGGGRYFILSDKKSFTEKSDTFIYAIILASNTILKGVHGGIASTCVAYFQGSRIDEAFQKGFIN